MYMYKLCIFTCFSLVTEINFKLDKYLQLPTLKMLNICYLITFKIINKTNIDCMYCIFDFFSIIKQEIILGNYNKLSKAWYSEIICFYSLLFKNYCAIHVHLICFLVNLIYDTWFKITTTVYIHI